MATVSAPLTIQNDTEFVKYFHEVLADFQTGKLTFKDPDWKNHEMRAVIERRLRFEAKGARVQKRLVAKATQPFQKMMAARGKKNYIDFKGKGKTKTKQRGVKTFFKRGIYTKMLKKMEELGFCAPEVDEMLFGN